MQRLGIALAASVAYVACASCGSTHPDAKPEVLSIVASHEASAMTVGGNVKLTWTVIGTTRRVKLQVVNRNPAVARLKGGDEQVVTTSGGTPNTVSVIASGKSGGVFDVEVTFAKSGGPKPESQAHERIVRMFAPTLHGIARKVAQASKELRVRQGRVRKEEVLRIIDAAESELAKALPEPEMAPLRDSVAEFLDEKRRSLDGANLKAHLVAWPPPPQEIQQSTAQSLLDAIVAFFDRAAGTAPLVTICLQTDPVAGATVRLSPRSIADWREVRSNSPMVRYVGRYRYEVRPLTGYRGSTGEVDLLLNPERLIVLPLRRNDQESQAPQYRPLAGACK